MTSLLRRFGFAERGIGPGGRTKPVQPPLTNSQAIAARLVPVDLDKDLPHPGVARAHATVSREHPSMGPGGRADHTVLQQHVDFFDRDGDGIIYPRDTYIGFRRIGFGRLISFGAIFVIHGTFSYVTSPTFLPSLFFPIHINRMHRTKHGSDSGVYDNEGRFIPQKFEELFSKYDAGNKGALSWDDVQDLVYGQMNVNDPVGWIAARLEWWVLWLAAADDKGLIAKDKVRAQFDGTLWEVLAAEQTKKRGYDIGAPRAMKQAATRKPPRPEQVTPAKPPPRSTSMDGVPTSGGGAKKSS